MKELAEEIAKIQKTEGFLGRYKKTLSGACTTITITPFNSEHSQRVTVLVTLCDNEPLVIVAHGDSGYFSHKSLILRVIGGIGKYEERLAYMEGIEIAGCFWDSKQGYFGYSGEFGDEFKGEEIVEIAGLSVVDLLNKKVQLPTKLSAVEILDEGHKKALERIKKMPELDTDMINEMQEAFYKAFSYLN